MANMNCENVQCKLEKELYYTRHKKNENDLDPKEEVDEDASLSHDNSDDCSYPEYTFIHCEVEGCHNQYFKDKNGQRCEACGLEICESCADEGGNLGDEDSDEEDEWLCSECLKERKKESKKERKRKLRKEQARLIIERQNKKRKVDK